VTYTYFNEFNEALKNLYHPSDSLKSFRTKYGKTKGGLISESFSLLAQISQKRCQNYPEHYPSAQLVTTFIFFSA
jgi:hypothetical protein